MEAYLLDIIFVFYLIIFKQLFYKPFRGELTKKEVLCVLALNPVIAFSPGSDELDGSCAQLTDRLGTSWHDPGISTISMLCYDQWLVRTNSIRVPGFYTQKFR